ncbi:MAG: nickel pincer cofactor biosynthesis protein LarC [Coriobacteriia bacterium]|nr:nickel pincer cofactor biosynthesis protein LarC [Coriobacteriia bacterium]
MSQRATIAYLDCSTGVSGDKFLGALLDAGELRGDFTAEHLRAVVTAIAPEVRVSVERVLSRGVSSLSVLVTAEGQPTHRHWSDIEALIQAADLADPVRASALRAFEALAAAEAVVHGVALEDVHFHEVGAIDSIVDIVGTCAGVHALGLDGAIVVGPVAVGSGTVETSHGVLPVPAPATAGLLADVPIVPGPATGELTTPTGAALLKALASGYGDMPPMMIDRLGYGAGTRDIGMPNVCRIMIGEPMVGHLGVPASDLQPVVLLETNIDHLPAEELAFAAEELLAAGALDVWQTPIFMKKGRSAVMLSVLANPADADSLAERAIALTGSLGVRRQTIERSCVAREILEVATPWGPARVKRGAGRLRPEHDDVARIARAHGLPYAAVAREIAHLAETPDPIDER